MLHERHLADDRENNVDNAEPLSVLHNLYLMTFTLAGRQAVVTVFTMSDKIQAVFPFIQFSGLHLSFLLGLFHLKYKFDFSFSVDKDSNTRVKRLLCHSYTVMLLLFVARETNDATFLQRFASPLLAFTDQGMCNK